jgi:hypothetical protein
MLHSDSWIPNRAKPSTRFSNPCNHHIWQIKVSAIEATQLNSTLACQDRGPGSATGMPAAAYLQRSKASHERATRHS